MGCPATAYAVHVGSIFGASDVASAHVGAATSLVAAGPPGSYYLRVVATNAFGASAASNEVLVTVGTLCQPPPLLPPELLTPTTSGSNLLLSWTPGGGSVTGYILEGGSSSGAVNLLNILLTGTLSHVDQRPTRRALHSRSPTEHLRHGHPVARGDCNRHTASTRRPHRLRTHRALDTYCPTGTLRGER